MPSWAGSFPLGRQGQHRQAVNSDLYPWLPPIVRIPDPYCYTLFTKTRPRVSDTGGILHHSAAHTPPQVLLLRPQVLLILPQVLLILPQVLLIRPRVLLIRPRYGGGTRFSSGDHQISPGYYP